MGRPTSTVKAKGLSKIDTTIIRETYKEKRLKHTKNATFKVIEDRRPRTQQKLDMSDVLNSLGKTQAGQVVAAALKLDSEQAESRSSIIPSNLYNNPTIKPASVTRRGKNAALLSEGKLFQSINALPEVQRGADPFQLVEAHLQASLALQPRQEHSTFQPKPKAKKTTNNSSQQTSSKSGQGSKYPKSRQSHSDSKSHKRR